MSTPDQYDSTPDALMVLDAFEKVTVDDLVQTYRNWVSAIEDLTGSGGLGEMDPVIEQAERKKGEFGRRAIALSAKLDRAADLIVSYTLAAYPANKRPEALAAAAAARLLFETMTDGPALRGALLLDDELLGGAGEVAA